MANTLLNPTMITREALMILENNLVALKHINRDTPGNVFGNDSLAGQKVGSTVNVRIPPRYLGRTGQAMNIEAAVERQTPVTLTTQYGVDLQFSSQELTLNIDDFSQRFIKPAVAKVANKIDSDILAVMAQSTFNSVGTPGTPPQGTTAFFTYLQAGVLLDNNMAPRDGDRSIILDPLAQAYAVDALKGLFNDTTEISKQYEEGTMGKTAGFKWSMDQNIAPLTIGAHGGTPVVNGASQVGNTLNISGATASVAFANAGDVFTIAGVYGINPQSQLSTNALQQFVVTQNVSATAGGLVALPISPAIIVAGTAGYATVSASPANNAALSFVGAPGTVSNQDMAFHKDSHTFVCADLEMPDGVDWKARLADRQVGVSMRLVRQYSISNDQFPCRLDVLYGVAPLRPELACRIQN